MRPVTYIKYNCQLCQQEYILPKAKFPKKTCSDSCLAKLRSKITSDRDQSVRRRGRYMKCPVCKKITYRYPSQVKKGYRSCSKGCGYLIREISERSIQSLHDNRHKQDYSNPARRAKASATQKERYASGKAVPRYGADNNLWKGGIATLQNSVRATPQYKEWRKEVYERDNYTCQHCGVSKDLNAHHIKEFSKYPDLRYEVSNGLTVCRTCHSKIHGRYLPNIANVLS